MGRRSHNDCNHCKGGMIGFNPPRPCRSCNKAMFDEWQRREQRNSPEEKTDRDLLVPLTDAEKAKGAAKLAALRDSLGV